MQFPLSIDSKRPVRVQARVAVSHTAKQSAVGRLLTAQLSDAVLSEILAANTPQDAAIKSQLNELRSSGQIIDRGAVEADVVSISKVIRGLKGEVVGAIEVLTPQYRAKVEDLMPAIDEAAQALSTALGSIKTGLSSQMEREVVAPAHMSLVK